MVFMFFLFFCPDREVYLMLYVLQSALVGEAKASGLGVHLLVGF